MQENLCPYSLYALQFYTLLPLVKIGQLISIPNALSYIFALGAPAIFLDYFFKFVQTKTDCSNSSSLWSTQSSHKHTGAITFGVIAISSILGLVFTIGLSFITEGSQSHFQPLGIYLILLSFFHFSEYFTTSIFNPPTLNLGSFLLDQSIAYVLAITSSFVEYIVEAHYYAGSKRFDYISIVGLCLAISGEIIRKTAMFTAGKSFTHAIASKKSPEHNLITTGIYSVFRHPSYAGWFYWAVGTQIFLKNPICTILFAVISYNFFRERIIYEEKTLIKFFGKDYKEYKKKVNLWMPLRL